MTKSNQPYLKCVFRDKRVDGRGGALARPSVLPGRRFVDRGDAYRLHVRGQFDVRYGMQLEILSASAPPRTTTRADGYDFFDLVPNSQFPSRRAQEEARRPDRSLHRPSRAQDAWSRTSSTSTMSLFSRMPAAQNIHHSYTSGLLEHVWSMTRIAGFLADHYAKYYDQLDPPLESRPDRRRHDPARYRQAARARVSSGRGQVHEGRLPDRPCPDGPRHGPRGRGAGSTGFPEELLLAWSTRSWRITASASSAPRSLPADARGPDRFVSSTIWTPR